MKLTRILLLSLMLLPWSAFAGRATEMDAPPVIDIPGKTSQEKVVSVIRKALKGRDWEIKSSDGGRITARYSRNEYSVKIAVVYNSKTITIKYVDSDHLNYEKKDGKAYIHPSYNRWVRILEKDINRGLRD